MVGSAAVVADGRKPQERRHFSGEVLEVKGERRGSVEWCWGGWIFFGGEEDGFSSSVLMWKELFSVFFFFFNLKMPGLGWSDEFGLGEGSRSSLAVRTTASGV